MASWPSNTRQTQRYAVERGKIKHKLQSQWDYPVLTEGAVNSATLYKKNGHLHWTTITGDNGRRLRSNGSVQIFPHTHSNRLETPTKSIFQKTEASARFLRKVYPDIEVSSSLIKDEIALDAEVLRKRQSFDPAIGNLLETVYCDEGSRKLTTFLAFPMGESSSQLSISPFHSGHGELVFNPSSRPILSFSTPIQQIVLSKSLVQSVKSNTVLAVRTMGSASLLSIQANMDIGNTPNPQVDEISQILPSEVGGRPLMDIQISHSSSDVFTLILNDHGSLYESNSGQGSKTVCPRYDNPEISTNDKGDSVWKLAVADDFSLCYITSNDLVRQFDLRTHARLSDLWTTKTPDSLITSVETPKADRLMRLVTTKEILWLDERYSKKPVMSVKHYRNFDRTLGIFTTSLSSVPLSFLTSRRTGLVSLYDVSQDQSELVHMYAPPYCLPPAISHPDLPLTGCTFMQHPSMRDSDIDIFHLSSEGNIHQLIARLSAESESSDRLQCQRGYFHWSDDIKELQTKARRPADLGLLVEREHSVVDFRAAYEDCIFFNPEDNENKEDEAAYDVVDKMPFFWQDSDISNDHVLTTFDVAFRSGEEPARVSRADFLSQSIINSKCGFHALQREKSLARSISNRATWSQSLTPVLQTFVPDISEDIHVMLNRLKNYNLSVYSDRAQQSFQWEVAACNQLALDLGLSTHVYSEKAFSKPSKNNLENAFETMSLTAGATSGERPPTMQFGFLTPILKNAIDHYSRVDKESERHSQKELTPLGVCLLLNEWTPRTDPNEYIYEDPYEDNIQATFPGRGQKLPRSPIIPIAASSQSQRPPLVVTTTTLAPPQVVALRRPEVQTQDNMLGFSQREIYTTEPESSQHIMISTQTVPGPFGGRQSMAKKKGGKKRIGGF